MDNKIFNVNGESQLQFELTLKLLLIDQYATEVGGFDTHLHFSRIGTNVSGYKFTYDKGLILFWYYDDDLKKKGVKHIDELIDKYLDKDKHNLLLKKYKLAKLDTTISRRVGVPLDILVDVLNNFIKNNIK